MNKNNHSECPIKRVVHNNIIYTLNEEAKTASIIDYKVEIQDIIIPRFIIHESAEYLVIGILKGSFENSNIISIQFPSNSEFQFIEKEAFSYSLIESLSIPSKLTDLQEEWCNCTQNLIRILISPKNARYIFFDNKFIIGKSTIENENFDELVFCVRNIENATIPNFIERICSCAFDNCKQLRNIEFANDSKLQTINLKAFCESTIENIKIPSKLKQIGEKAFFYCEKLSRIKIEDDSELQIIEKEAFAFSSIESITISSNLYQLKEKWCFMTPKLNEIVVSSKNPYYKSYEDKFIIGKSTTENENFNELVFCIRNIKFITIPIFIKRICSCAFSNCQQIQSIEFTNDSRLQKIDDNAFAFSSIKYIKIPSEVIQIGERAFYNCQQLKRIEFSNDSKLQKIGKEAFSNSSIENISIPSQVTQIGEFAFSCCEILNKVDIPSDSKLQVIEKGAFISTLIEKIILPSNITILGEACFSCCEQLQVIEIPIDSKLQKFDNYVFYESSITSFRIPSNITEIESNAFSYCEQLQIIEITGYLEVFSIFQSIFENMDNTIIMIPVK